MKIERHHDARPGNRIGTSIVRWLAGFTVAMGFLMGAAPAEAETRTLKLYFIHTKERAEITYKRNGRYDAAGLSKVNKFLRDWRRNEPTKMDPRLLDLVWETYRAVGARDYINVVSAYRSPATNTMLRSRSKGVANKSQHMLGKAMDFYIPGVGLKNLRNAALRMQGGGVGYYPRSGSPFVHLDVGNVRHWPRMSRKELVAVFPKGKTLHVPSDGKPLPGFEQAMASYQTRKKGGGGAVAYASAAASGKSGKGLFATLFGGGADEEEESGGSVVASAAAPRAKPAKPVKAVAAAPKAEVKKALARQPAAREPARAPGIQIVPPELAEPAMIARPPEEIEPQFQEPETAETIVASLPARNIPVPLFAPRALAEVPIEMAAAVEAPFANATPVETLTPDPPEQAAELAEPPVEIALGIPLPTRRPRLAAAPVGDPVLLALAAPEARPAIVADAPTMLPAPSTRSDTAGLTAADSSLQPPGSPTELFALPEPRPQPVLAAADPLPETADLPAENRRNSARIAALEASEAATSALRRIEPETDPSATASVRTTKKAARPSAKGARPARKSVVVAAQPKTARWALYGDPVATNGKGTTAPSLAYNIVRTAPVEVYTAGFQQDAEAAPTDRFSGKAVKFLSVARFATN